MLFHKIVYYALLVGILSGLIVTIVQFWQVVPIIHSAEVFESQPSLEVQDFELSEDAHDLEHTKAWTPKDGFERTAYTFLSNSVIAAAFAIIMLVAMLIAYKNKDTIRFDWRYGLGWGSAGYIIFFLAPALGFPPEIPLATTTVSLEMRQLWWLLAVVCTAAGLAGLIFGKAPWRWVAPILLVVPHLLITPDSSTTFNNLPPVAVTELEQLAKQFIGATAIANAVLWLVLGLASAWAVQRIKPNEN